VYNACQAGVISILETEAQAMESAAEHGTDPNGRNGYKCDTCNISESDADKGKFNRCANCKRVRYCSRECQLKHWKHGGHKTQCKILKEAHPLDVLSWRDHPKVQPTYFFSWVKGIRPGSCGVQQRLRDKVRDCVISFIQNLTDKQVGFRVSIIAAIWTPHRRTWSKGFSVFRGGCRTSWEFRCQRGS
jgi:hypothetical protein